MFPIVLCNCCTTWTKSPRADSARAPSFRIILLNAFAIASAPIPMPCERQKQALEVKFLSRASRGNTGSGSCESPLSSNSMFHSLFTFLTVSKTEILNIMNPKLVKSKIVRKQKSGVLRQHVIVMRQNRTLPKKSALRLTLRSLRSHRTIKDGFPDRSAF